MEAAIPVFVLLFISLSFFIIRCKWQLKITDERQEHQKAELEASSSARAELRDSQGKETMLVTTPLGPNEIRELDSIPISAGQVQRRKPVPNPVTVLPSNLGTANVIGGMVRDVDVEQSRGKPASEI